jgi:hypothetical protein
MRYTVVYRRNNLEVSPKKGKKRMMIKNPDTQADLEVIDVDRDLPTINKPYVMKLSVEKQKYEFAGVLLAWGSSESGDHRDHANTDYAPKGVKCSACRWLEVELYSKFPDQVNEDNGQGSMYVVVTRGPSIVPGERDYEKITFTESAYEVVEVLTVRKTRGTQSTFLPPQHARALAQAAAHDDGIKDAYLEAVA